MQGPMPTMLTRACPENGIVGEALIALRHDELKEMGINSVGHRLTILKSVYEIKIRQHVPLDMDHYIPLCMFDLPLHTIHSSDLYDSGGSEHERERHAR